MDFLQEKKSGTIQMNIYKRNIEKTYTGYNSTTTQEFKRTSKRQTYNPTLSIAAAYQTCTSSHFITVFDARLQGRFIAIKHNFITSRFHIMHQASDFL